jgi:hypothetical protein
VLPPQAKQGVVGEDILRVLTRLQNPEEGQMGEGDEPAKESVHLEEIRRILVGRKEL